MPPTSDRRRPDDDTPPPRRRKSTKRRRPRSVAEKAAIEQKRLLKVRTQTNEAVHDPPLYKPDFKLKRSTATPPPETPDEPASFHKGKSFQYVITRKEQRGVMNRAIAAAKDPEFFPDVTHYSRRLFLSAYMEMCSKTAAADAIGVSRYTVFSQTWQNDVAFQDAVSMAQVVAADALEAEAYRRGVLGVEEPVGWYKGQAGGMVKKFSDVLLIVLMKGAMPDKYKDRVEMRGLMANIDFDKLPHAVIAAIADGQHPLQALGALVEENRIKGLLKEGQANETASDDFNTD